tara:strand:+ start:410 stop:1099 length:690 start_codon:yes stop_codon:yes gene_type:complete
MAKKHIIDFEGFFNFLDKYHQKKIINFLKKYKIRYFIDVGSHKGEFLSYLIKLKYKKIFCFEPQKEIYKLLVNKFHKKKNILFFNVGLGNHNKKKILHINSLTSTSTFSEYKNNYFTFIKRLLLNSTKNSTNDYKVKIKKLDNCFKNYRINDCLLKIDVEGYELEVLQGSLKSLKKKIKFVLIERQMLSQYKSYDFKKIELILKKNNFKLTKKFIYPTFHFQDILYKKE